MNKDKQWLKEKVREMSELKTEPDYYGFNGPRTSFESYIETRVVCSLIDKMDEAPEPAKPVIPEFVAKWIEESKGWSEEEQDYAEDNASSLFNAMDTDSAAMSNEIREYVIDNSETFARAWLNGYEVEKEKRYRVKLTNGTYLIKSAYSENFWFNKYPELYLERDVKYTFTGQEIKAIDERFWPFAEEVTE